MTHSNAMIATRAARQWRILMLLLVVCAHQTHADQSGRTRAAPAAPQAAAAVFVDPLRLERAHARLARVSGSLRREVPLAELLTAMLSPADDGDRTTRPEQHRAALVALAFYVNQWPIELIVQDARAWPRATPRRVTLGGRRDHARHFIVSAAMAATVGSPLAEAVAIYKELEDARRGSGFSFSDVAANRAGQRFGTLASVSATSAARLAARLHAPLTDGDIMPDTAGLPDGLGDQEFTRRFGTIGSDVYTRMVGDIDERVSALGLYR